MSRPSSRIRKIHRSLTESYEALGRMAADADRLALQAPDVSKWSVGLHVDHLAKADGLIYGNLEDALEAGRAPGDGRPKLLGRVMLFLGRIPRGRAKAVGGTVPEDDLDPAALAGKVAQRVRSLQAFGDRLGDIEALEGTFPHPILGEFEAKSWLRFSQVHMNHHLRIVREIEAAA